MKRYEKIFNFTLLVTLLAATMVGCKPSTDVAGEKAYSVMVNIVLFESPTDADYQTKKELLEKKLGDAGLYNDGKFVTFNGTSPAAVGKTVSEKLKEVAREMAEAPMDVRSALFAYGIESSLLGSAEKVELGGNFQLMAYEQTGTPENGSAEVIGMLGEGHDRRWVKDISLGNLYEYSDYTIGAGFTPQSHSLLLTHSGKAGSETEFEWEDGVNYITDVIGVYNRYLASIDEAQPFVIEGRTYTPQFICYTTRGEQVTFYSTTDPMPINAGFYLNTGYRRSSSSARQCRAVVYSDIEDFNRNLILASTMDGHNCTERAVKAYNPDGTLHGNGLVDLDGRSSYSISFILTYVKR